MILGTMSSGLPLLVCAFGVPRQVKTHHNSGFENDLKDYGMFESGLLAAFVASVWLATIFEPEVIVVAALIAVVAWRSGVRWGLLVRCFFACGFAATFWVFRKM